MKLVLWLQKIYFIRKPSKKLKIEDLFRILEGLNYTVLKNDVPYMPKDFPFNYPVGKDLDILVSKNDFMKAKTLVSKFAESSNWEWNYKVIEDIYRYKIRFLWNGRLHFQIDLTGDLNNPVLEKALLDDRIKINNMYYVPSIETEVLLRMLEYQKNKTKKHHLDYIIKNKSMWNHQLSESTGIRFPEKRNIYIRIKSHLINRYPWLKKMIHIIYSVLKKVDIIKCFFIKKMLDKGFYICIPPEVLLVQEYKATNFCRYDTIVRLLTIENYLEKGDDAFVLYNKMQYARGALEGYENRFKNLINSVYSSYYRINSVIKVGRDGHLLDGSHRLAIALYFQIPLITCELISTHKGVMDYGMDWFLENGFSKEECELIQNKKESVFWDKGLYFPVILWPAVSEFFGEIVLDISKKYRIVSSNEYLFTDDAFEIFIRDIYEVDDIEEWKINKKIDVLKPFRKIIMLLWVEFPNPGYRKKGFNNAYISTVGEQFKSNIREKYKKRVKNYFNDIICHTSDNHEQNKIIYKIFADLEKFKVRNSLNEKKCNNLNDNDNSI